MEQEDLLKHQTSNIDDVEQLIQECNKININENESEISFDLGQFNDYLQNQKAGQMNSSQCNQNAKSSVNSKNEHDLDNSEEKDKITNFNNIDSIVQKSQFNFNESVFTHQISRQIGQFESSRIEHNNNDFKNGLVNQNQFNENNISDNYVEYIEKFLKNINIQDNEKSIEQALQIANQNLNLDQNQQSIMLNSLLYEINNIQFQENNDNDIMIMNNSLVKKQDDSQEQQQNEQDVQVHVQPQLQDEEQPKQEQNQSNVQTQQTTVPTIQTKGTEKIKQILKQKSAKDKLCHIFQMISFLLIQ